MEEYGGMMSHYYILFTISAAEGLAAPVFREKLREEVVKVLS